MKKLDLLFALDPTGHNFCDDYGMEYPNSKHDMFCLK